jgi:hypothetical protein
MNSYSAAASSHGFAFEKVVKAIFFEMARRENSHEPKEFNEKGISNFPDLADMRFPDGLKTLRIKGPLYIEIKNIYYWPDIERFAKRVVPYISHGTLIFVINAEESTVMQARTLLDRYFHTEKIRILGRDFVFQYASYAKAEFLFFIQSENLEYGRIQATQKGRVSLTYRAGKKKKKLFLKERDFKQYQEAVEARIQKKIANEKDKITLLLGNGLSISVGAKSWECLRQELCLFLGNYLSFASIDRSLLGQSSYSDTLLSHYTCANSYCEDSYYQTIHRCLYGSVNIPSERQDDNSLLAGTAVFIERHKPEVLTLNYDSLLEEELKLSKSKRVTPIWNKNQKAKSKNVIYIYHLQGYLPRLPAIPEEKNKKSIVLDEDEYADFYYSEKDWRKKKLDKALKQRTCFFIGLSLSDTFLRNCVRKSDNKDHFAFLCKNGLPNFPDLAILTSIFFNMNIDVLWFDSYQEISGKLRSL